MPPFKIQAHVLAFSLALTPCVFYGIHYFRNKKSDEEFETMLRKDYSTQINLSKAQNKQFVNVIQGIKSGTTASDVDSDLSRLLHAGKDEIKKRQNIEQILLIDSKNKAIEKKDEDISQPATTKKKDGKKKKRKKKAKRLNDKDDISTNMPAAANNGNDSFDGSSVALFLITMGSFAMFSGKRN